MNKPVAPFNNIIVQIDEKFKEEIELEGGLKLFQDTSFRPEWHVTVTGKVISVPRKVDSDGWLSRGNIRQQVEVGDEIAFSYLVVFDLMNRDDSDEVFYEEIPIDPFLTTYSNKLGHKIIVRYRMNDSKFDVAFLTEGNILTDKQEKLSELEKESYLGRYKFSETNKVTYNNLLELVDGDYWLVDYAHVLAIKKGSELIAGCGKVILSTPEMTQSADEEAGIILLNKANRSHSHSKIIALGAPLIGARYVDVEPGDRVVYDKRYAEQYSLWGTDVLVVPHKRLLATV